MYRRSFITYLLHYYLYFYKKKFKEYSSSNNLLKFSKICVANRHFQTYTISVWIRIKRINWILISPRIKFKLATQNLIIQKYWFPCVAVAAGGRSPGSQNASQPLLILKNTSFNKNSHSAYNTAICHSLNFFWQNILLGIIVKRTFNWPSTQNQKGIKIYKWTYLVTGAYWVSVCFRLPGISWRIQAPQI